MGNILNPKSTNSFIDLVNSRDQEIFVDKTLFLDETNKLLNTTRKFLAFTRPRRFGKTITAHMLSAYYSKGYAGQHIFDGLKITGNDYKASFEKHLNKYDVIYIDMNSIKDKYNSYKYDKSLYIDGIDDIVDFLQFRVIRELKENPNYAEELDKDPLVGKKSLSSALEAICRYTGERFIFIMDEWDLIYRDYRDESVLQEKFIEFMRGLFKSDDGQACFALAYLTGILPIKKYNSQSALNNFKEYNMLKPEPYEEYFGFTKNEVAELANKQSCKPSPEELKDWYDGYKLNGKDIYNPNSVVSAISDGVCYSYWSGTSSNEEVVRLINMNFEGIRDDLLNLLAGKEVSFDCSTFQNDMVSIKYKDDVFCLLVCLGYLGCKDKNNKKESKLAYVPNEEIRSALIRIVKHQSWYERMEAVQRSEKMLEAILKLDGDTVAAIIQEIHNSRAVSLLTYNSEESLTYCVMSGLLWSTLDDYTCHREEQSGKGRVDVVYIPDSMEHPLIIIEFKYDTSAEEALSQIKSREYFNNYMSEYPDIIMAGINYSTQTKEHQCVIEKFNINGNI